MSRTGRAAAEVVLADDERDQLARRRTFERLLEVIGDPQDLWLVIFVLRVFGYDEIAGSFARYGLVTERVPGLTVRQLRFADREEYEAANHDIVLRGLDPAGKETEGWYYADCFLTRPAAAAAQTTITELLGRRASTREGYDEILTSTSAGLKKPVPHDGTRLAAQLRADRRVGGQSDTHAGPNW